MLRWKTRVSLMFGCSAKDANANGKKGQLFFQLRHLHGHEKFEGKK